jgi:cell division protein FtsB
MTLPLDRPRSLFRQHLRLAILLLLVLLAASVLGNRGLLRLYQMHRTGAALRQEVDRLSAANAALGEEVQALRDDPGRLEAIAREELGLIKPGEIVYQFQTPARTPSPVR